MSKYAEIKEGRVVNIVECEDSFAPSLPGDFIKVTDQTNQAFIGSEYSYEKNKFKEPQPGRSWVLNENSFKWEPPVPKPGENYDWNEVTESWEIRSL